MNQISQREGLPDPLAAKYDALLQSTAALRSAIVAFSGGVDSAVMLAVAVKALGSKKVQAITARSPAVPAMELTAVESLTVEIGVAHEFINTREFEHASYLANPPNRCYFCKTELYSQLTRIAQERGYGAVVNGVNADDLGDFRPGLEAAREHGVIAPLADCHITKADVRRIAALHGLSIADKPASPCLSSRVQYGEAITPEKLRRIDAGETFLRLAGFAECRVRHHGNLARIEVPAAELARFADASLRMSIDAKFRELGYQYVSLDLRGFRSGSMNEVHLGQALRAALG